MFHVSKGNFEIMEIVFFVFFIWSIRMFVLEARHENLKFEFILIHEMHRV